MKRHSPRPRNAAPVEATTTPAICGFVKAAAGPWLEELEDVAAAAAKVPVEAEELAYDNEEEGVRVEEDEGEMEDVALRDRAEDDEERKVVEEEKVEEGGAVEGAEVMRVEGPSVCVAMLLDCRTEAEVARKLEEGRSNVFSGRKMLSALLLVCGVAEGLTDLVGLDVTS